MVVQVLFNLLQTLEKDLNECVRKKDVEGSAPNALAVLRSRALFLGHFWFECQKFVYASWVYSL